MTGEAEKTIGIYRRHAHAFDRLRTRTLIEKDWLDRFLAAMPASRTVLDLGCGSGEPIGRYLIGNGCRLVGVDSSPPLLSLCWARLPSQRWVEADMRHLALGERFAGILAWDSFFFLPPDDQRQMFDVFAAHADAGGALMFTSGPEASERVGEFEGEPLYHASLSEREYRRLLDSRGLDVLAHRTEDPDCGGHTVWLARRRSSTA